MLPFSPDFPLNPQARPAEHSLDAQIQNHLNIADTIFNAMAGPFRRPKTEAAKQPEPEQKPSPTEQTSPEKQSSTFQFDPGHIFELIFAANHLARFVVSEDLRDCAACGASNGNMLDASAHHPACKVARVWESIDRFRITVEGR